MLNSMFNTFTCITLFYSYRTPELHYVQNQCLNVHLSTHSSPTKCHPSNVSDTTIKCDQVTGPVSTMYLAAAAAKSLQSCATLCDPIDGSPPGSPVPGILPGKNTGAGCHFLLPMYLERGPKASHVITMSMSSANNSIIIHNSNQYLPHGVVLRTK